MTALRINLMNILAVTIFFFGQGSSLWKSSTSPLTTKTPRATPVEVEAEQIKFPAISVVALCTWRTVVVNVWFTPPWSTSYFEVLMEILPVDDDRGMSIVGTDQATIEGSGVENRHDSSRSWPSPSWWLTVLPGSWLIKCGPGHIVTKMWHKHNLQQCKDMHTNDFLPFGDVALSLLTMPFVYSQSRFQPVSAALTMPMISLLTSIFFVWDQKLTFGTHKTLWKWARSSEAEMSLPNAGQSNRHCLSREKRPNTQRRGKSTIPPPRRLIAPSLLAT